MTKKWLAVILSAITAFSTATVSVSAIDESNISADNKAVGTYDNRLTESEKDKAKLPTQPVQPETKPPTAAPTEAYTQKPTEAVSELPPSAPVPEICVKERTMGVGEQCELADFVKNDFEGLQFSYISSNNNIAYVDIQNKKVVAHGVGTAVITVANADGVKQYFMIEVKPAPKNIYLNKTSITLGVGEIYKLSPSFKNGEGAYDIEYFSMNTAVAAVDKSSGVITANTVGSLNIIARTYNGKTAICTVTVKNAPTSLGLNKTKITVGEGEQFDFNSSLPSGQGAYSIKYSSSNSSVAGVKSAGGLMTAKNPGTAVITATAYNGVSVSAVVTVKKAPASMGLNKKKITVGVGEQFDFNSSLPSGQGAYSIKYSSSNSSVAGVKSAGGLMTAKKAGTATITATAYNGVRVSAVVTVKKAPTKLSLNKTKITVGVGEQFDFNSSLPSGQGAYSIKYSSSNSSVASVKSAGGLMTAKKTGTATIIATAYNGVKVKATVSVIKAPTSAVMNTPRISLGLNDTFTLYVDFPKSTSTDSILYISNNSRVATINQNGLVTAKGYGKATITATTYNGLKTTCVVTVEKNTITTLNLIAKSQEGNNAVKYRTWFYGSECRGVHWCAVYVSWLYGQIGGINNYVVKTDGAGCFAREGVPRGYGIWYESNYSCYTTKPQAGDIVTFTWNGRGRSSYGDIYYSDHVGYVYAVDNTYIYTVEGNTVANGETYYGANSSRVVLKRYNKNSGVINGYFRPNY